MRRPLGLRLIKQDRWVANGRAFQPRLPCGGEYYFMFTGQQKETSSFRYDR